VQAGEGGPEAVIDICTEFAGAVRPWTNPKSTPMAGGATLTDIAAAAATVGTAAATVGTAVAVPVAVVGEEAGE